MKKKVAICTLGCKVNQYDSEAMSELLVQSGFELTDFENPADIYIINTCTVTNVADKKSRQMIKRAKRKNGDALICVCGCLAQRASEELLAQEGIDLVIGNQQRGQIVSYIEEALEQQKKLNKVKPILGQRVFEELQISKTGEKTRGYVKICEGCNNFCTYCIIPYARGPVRSRSLQSIVDEAKRLAGNGVKELVFTGIHIASYGIDLPEDIGLLEVIAAVHQVEGIERIRLGSLEPGILQEDFIAQIASMEKLCEHFHISLQSGCDSVLRRMGRRYTTSQYAQIVSTLRQYFAHPAITTDIMTGFPGETEQDFETTLAFAQQIGFAHLHVFPYSEREGTKAATMEGSVPVHERKVRAERLIALGRQMEKKYLESMVGTRQQVLLEEPAGSSFFTGYTKNYCKVKAKGGHNALKNVIIKGLEDEVLIGETEE